MRVLVVEDEIRLAANVAQALREGPGFAVDLAHDGEEALLVCSSHPYDLILLDLMIPRIDGGEVVRRLRAQQIHTPILVLTAKSETQSTIDLLNLGADDYMTKPFDLGELIARVRALIRRGKGTAQSVLTFGVLTLNTAEQTVTSGGELVDLSPTEYRILEYLLHRPRLIVSKRELLEHLYDFTWEHHSNVIEAHVSNLRRKLRLTTETIVLETFRGRGYRLAAPESVL
ncbi:response regulator transcription factor [Edaphobacter bradus]|uniref:response regulator transcription factor n=1 Tax=Edaphobacter bradus TaxID=2259016 RepID=UPI0021E0894B|nr:response regulator transcription factor [Edaphobacter bradus]